MSLTLVTGATGFIGRHLVEALVQRGARVRCLVRGSSKTEALTQLGVELTVGELDQAEKLQAALAGVTQVLHIAGIIKALSAAEFDRVNGEGTALLAAACAQQDQPPRLIYVSSVSAAGPAPRGQIRSESDPPAPMSHYGRSKLAGEEAIRRLAARLRATIVRPGIVFGPRDDNFVRILQFIKAARFHISPGLHPPALSFIHVADLVELLLRAAEGGSRVPAEQNGQPERGRYFAVAPEHPTYAELGQIVRPMLRRPWAPVVSVPGPAAWCVACACEGLARLRGRPDPINFDKIREALTTSWACSGEAARRDLDFVPAMPLAQRLEETVAWYQSAGWL